MPRAPKTVENMSKNLTKSEREYLENAEKATLSGMPITEFKKTKKDKIAHKEFVRVTKLLSAVGKNDAMYEAVINDYCMYLSDIERNRTYREKFEKDIDELDELFLADEITISEKMRMRVKHNENILSCDKQINALQRKRFEIEKETGFTVASSLRSIPKKQIEESDPLDDALK